MDTVPMDVADMIRDVNASNEAVEDQCLRARQAADIAARSDQAAVEADADARKLEVAHTTVQAERPRRRAPLPRQVTIALGTVALDGVACYFAANSPWTTTAIAANVPGARWPSSSWCSSGCSAR